VTHNGNKDDEGLSWQEGRCSVSVCVCVRRTVHAHHWFKITLPNTDQAHDKHL